MLQSCLKQQQQGPQSSFLPRRGGWGSSIPALSPKSPSGDVQGRGLWELLRRDRGWCHSHRDTMGTHSSGSWAGAPSPPAGCLWVLSGPWGSGGFLSVPRRSRNPPGAAGSGPAPAWPCWDRGGLGLHPSQARPCWLQGSCRASGSPSQGVLWDHFNLRGESTGICSFTPEQHLGPCEGISQGLNPPTAQIPQNPSLAGLEKPSTPSP